MPFLIDARQQGHVGLHAAFRNARQQGHVGLHAAFRME